MYEPTDEQFLYYRRLDTIDKQDAVRQLFKSNVMVDYVSTTARVLEGTVTHRVTLFGSVAIPCTQDGWDGSLLIYLLIYLFSYLLNYLLTYLLIYLFSRFVPVHPMSSRSDLQTAMSLPRLPPGTGVGHTPLPRVQPSELRNTRRPVLQNVQLLLLFRSSRLRGHQRLRNVSDALARLRWT